MPKSVAQAAKRGTGLKLTEAQKAEIRKAIRSRRPRELGLRHCLWDRTSVLKLIAGRYGIKLTGRSVDTYLRHWGLALDRATAQPSARCTETIREWLKLNYDKLERQAVDEDAAIFWLNPSIVLDHVTWDLTLTSTDNSAVGETLPEFEDKDATNDDLTRHAAMSNDDVLRALIGSVHPTDPADQEAHPAPRLQMISVVTNHSLLRWRVINGRFDSDQQIRFLKSLIDDNRASKMYLIRSDPARYHSREVIRWLRDNGSRIAIFP